MNKLRLLIVAVIVLGVIFAAQCLYTIKPYEDVVQLRFGGMVTPHRAFGAYNLYVKWPSFIDRYVPIDNRLQVTDAVLETISTSGTGNPNFQVSAACSAFWRVADAEKFYTSLLSQYKETVPEQGSSYPAKVNEQIRNIIRSSVNNVFGEARLSELFGLPLFTGIISRDCLDIEGKILLPKDLQIRGGQIKGTLEQEIWIVGRDGNILELPPEQRKPTACVQIMLYGYDREPVQAEGQKARNVVGRELWLVKPDPFATEGLDRKELTLTIPLRYIDDHKIAETVQIEQIQEKITEQVNTQAFSQYGVEVARVELRRLSFPASNISSVYDKMRSERNAVAEAYISSGTKEARIMLAKANYVASRQISQAEGKARAIKGRADAEAAEIAAEIQKLDPEFYNWLQSLETAAEILKHKSWVVLSTHQTVMDVLFGSTSEEPSKSEDSIKKSR